ncbi:MAG: phosphoribosylformylglycinamidine synthase, partial [Oscillibacter sp.]|nr:phosphoribosylformylglycinamidine synthase [Oscillibacter sp.]
LDHVDIADSQVQAAYERYLSLRNEVYGPDTDRPRTLMDIATMGARALKKRGVLRNLDESEEINACSVHVTAAVDGQEQDWLLMFKNETHNHPTEIEPFGGAATCIGGCIRDPLSGRAYVHQAMRVTGCGDPRTPVDQTIPGKLPQRKLAQTAAAGYSSYGNQIGLATGMVSELYHPGYIAKHMEVGAVVAAAPAENVVRQRPAPGDVVILLGGRTGRDGIGGATGSSKSHNSQSLSTMASEVQKGNAPEERKLQRLFRDGSVTRLIKRCNDFGAGGVSVAVGELADGLEIDLDAVRKKYEGLDGTELAISESQERMAVVVAPEDAEAFMAAAKGENLEAYPVAVVTEEPRVVMRWQGETIVSLSRAFLNTNGAEKHISVSVPIPDSKADAVRTKGSADKTRTEDALDTLPGMELAGHAEPDSKPDTLRAVASSLDCASRRGLAERFDSTIGAGSILMPFGGKYQRTPAQAMAALLPVLPGQETEDGSVMAWGFDPYHMSENPYQGARESVILSLAKLTAAGCDYRTAYLTFQEYFEKLGQDPCRWGKPFAALLGALDAQMEFGTAAIGGKDSMSGSFLDRDVPPTLISFAIAPVKAKNVLSAEFKGTGHPVCLFGYGAQDADTLRKAWEAVQKLHGQGKIRAAWAVEHSAAEAVMKMSFGNGIGFRADGPFRLDRMAKAAKQAASGVDSPNSADGGNRGMSPADKAAAGFSWFRAMPGVIVAELPVDANPKSFGAVRIGLTTAEDQVDLGGDSASIEELLSLNEGVLADVYPNNVPVESTDIPSWNP